MELSIVDFVLHFNIYLTQFVAGYGAWVYALLFAIIFCETGLVVTPVLPGDSLLFLAGALAARSGTGLSANLLFFLLAAAAFSGDTVNYLIGKYFGHRLFAQPDSKIFRQSRLQRTHAFFERYGGATVIIARFVPIVRTGAPLVAGMARMAYPRFMGYNAAGGCLWVGLFVFGGYTIGDLPWIQAHLKLSIAAIIALSLLPAIVGMAYHGLHRHVG